MHRSNDAIHNIMSFSGVGRRCVFFVKKRIECRTIVHNVFLGIPTVRSISNRSFRDTIFINKLQCKNVSFVSGMWKKEVTIFISASRLCESKCTVFYDVAMCSLARVDFLPGQDDLVV